MDKVRVVVAADEIPSSELSPLVKVFLGLTLRRPLRTLLGLCLDLLGLRCPSSSLATSLPATLESGVEGLFFRDFLFVGLALFGLGESSRPSSASRVSSIL